MNKSDARLKKDVQTIPNALLKVLSMRGVTFNWNHSFDSMVLDDGNHFGVIAQDVQKVFPVAVRTRPDGSLAVDYEKLSALAFAAVAELSTRVKSLEARI